MGWSFFGAKNDELPQQTIVYILSLLDSESQFNALRVNKQWCEAVFLAQKHMDLISKIQGIPGFPKLDLGVVTFEKMPGGMTNTTYKMVIGRDYSQINPKHKCLKFVLRDPGNVGLFGVDRASEGFNAQQVSDLGLNPSMKHFDKMTGVQISELIPKITALELRNDVLRKLAFLAKKLHLSKPFLNKVDVFNRNEQVYRALQEKEFIVPDGTDFVLEQMLKLKELFTSYQIEPSPCHNDSIPGNYLVSQEGVDEVIYQIDWEYSGNNDKLWDLVYFAIEAKLNAEQENVYLNAYFGEGNVSQLIGAWYTAYKPVVEWWITLWSWTQLANKASAVDLQEYQQLGAERFEKTLGYLRDVAFGNAMQIIEADRGQAFSINPMRPF